MMALVALTVFNGCQKEELTDRQLTDEEVQPQEVVQPDVYVENGYLAFKNMEAVDSVIRMFNGMTPKEFELWENQIDFKSARSEFEALFEEYENLKSYSDFVAFKKRNKDKLLFNDNDENDCSIDYPYATKYFTPVLNNKGICKIGNTIMKFTKDNQIAILDGDVNKLRNLSAYMNDEMVITMPKLKSTIINKETSSIHSFPEDDPKGDDNEWHRKPNISNRKLKNELYYERYILSDTDPNYPYTTRYRNGILVYLNQRGQKISWGRWVNYKTQYSIREVRFQVSGYSEVQDGRYHVSAEVKPSVNFYLHNHFEITPYIPQNYLPYPSFVYFAAKVTFRGFGFDYEDYYRINNPENYTIAGGYTYPSSGWGW